MLMVTEMMVRLERSENREREKRERKEREWKIGETELENKGEEMIRN